MFRKKHVEMESWFSGRKLRSDLAPREIGTSLDDAFKFIEKY